MSLFRIRHLTHAFHGLMAVSRFNLEMRAGELVGLIGPNGAGKTTVFNLISGIYKPREGNIYLDDFDISGLSPHEIARLGVARTFQNIRIFPEMSVLDNVKAASVSHVEYGLFSSLFHPPSFWREECRLDEYCLGLLKTFGLDGRSHEPSMRLSYGQKRRLEIARALASRPRILLLDEPAAGMNPQETRTLMDTLSLIRREFNLTILVIEHNMELIMRVSERILVMDFGEIIAQGTPAAIRENPLVIEAYLGKGSADAA